jgi:hypothetical protein
MFELLPRLKKLETIWGLISSIDELGRLYFGDMTVLPWFNVFGTWVWPRLEIAGYKPISIFRRWDSSPGDGIGNGKILARLESQAEEVQQFPHG